VGAIESEEAQPSAKLSGLCSFGRRGRERFVRRARANRYRREPDLEAVAHALFDVTAGRYIRRRLPLCSFPASDE